MLIYRVGENNHPHKKPWKFYLFTFAFWHDFAAADFFLQVPTNRTTRRLAFNQVLASGWVVILKPTLSFDADGRRYSGGWGDTVVLSVDGPRRLGSRPPGLVFTGETN